MRLHPLLLGLLCMALGVAFFALTLNFPQLPGQNVGPALFPRLIAVGVVLCGLVIAWQGRGQRQAWAERGQALRGRGAWGFAATLAAVLFYLLAAERVGFLPVATVIVALLSLWMGVRAWRAWLLGVLAAGVIHWFFASLMRVPLPRGWFMQLLVGG